MSDKIVLKLNTPMYELDGSEIKIIEKVKDRFIDGREKTIEELRQEAPTFTIGDGLARVIMFMIEPKDAEDTAYLNRIARRIQNNKNKNGGELEIDETQLKQYLEICKRARIQTGSQHVLGDILNYLQDSLDDYNATKRSKE